MVNENDVRAENKNFLNDYLRGVSDNDRYAEPTNRNTIAFWLNDAIADDYNTHVVIATDTFDYSDYPVRVSAKDNIDDVISRYNGNMQKVMEVYNLNVDISKQINSRSNWVI